MSYTKIITNINKVVPNYLCGDRGDATEWVMDHLDSLAPSEKLTKKKKCIISELVSHMTMFSDKFNDVIEQLSSFGETGGDQLTCQYAIESLWFNPSNQTELRNRIKNPSGLVKDPNAPKRNKSAYVIWSGLYKRHHIDAFISHETTMAGLAAIWKRTKGTDDDLFVRASALAVDDKKRYCDEMINYMGADYNDRKTKKSKQTRRKGHKSAWNLFLTTRIQEMKADPKYEEMNYKELQKVLGGEWKNRFVSGMDIQKYSDMAKDHNDQQLDSTIMSSDDDLASIDESDEEEHVTDHVSDVVEMQEPVIVEVVQPEIEEPVVEATKADKKHTAYWHYCSDNIETFMDQYPGHKRNELKALMKEKWTTLKKCESPSSKALMSEYKDKAAGV